MSLANSIESSVRSRYSSAAGKREEALCCPVDYQPDLLTAIPQEILERDYGCGDPSPFVKPGDTVVDLGSGTGKLCYIAAQLVGASGRVIGVDCNPEMLALARHYRGTVAETLGFENVDFRCGMIQDLGLDLELYAEQLNRRKITGVEGILERRTLEHELRERQPLIESDSVDCVVSNCVLNLVRPQDREQLFREVFRVLRRGGRAAISDIVADESVPAAVMDDPEMWSGCIGGAWQEDAFLEEFQKAGFHGIQIARRQEQPWQTIAGVEFRSMTVVAYKGKQGPCLERNQAVIYRGPFAKVEDDDGHVYHRGGRTAVCDKTHRLLQQEPYAGSFLAVEPREEIPLESAVAFDCRRNARRHPRETKGESYSETTQAAEDCCLPEDPCC